MRTWEDAYELALATIMERHGEPSADASEAECEAWLVISQATYDEIMKAWEREQEAAKGLWLCAGGSWTGL